MNEEIGESVGSSLVVDKACFKGFARFAQDELVLMDLPEGSCAEFFAGAAWGRDSRFEPFSRKWPRISAETTFESLLGQ